MIAEWERELGLPASATVNSAATSSDNGSGLTVEVQPWQFMGKSQPDAARSLLNLVKHPLTTEEIVDGIRRGGVAVKGKKNTFYAILNRSEEFVRVAPNTWGLAEWPGRKVPKKKRETKATEGKGKQHRLVLETKSARDNVGSAVREVMKDGRSRSKDQIVKAVEQYMGHPIKPIAVFGTLRNKSFVQVDGQYRMAV
jgi:DNA-directed RNA polymerase delta subunit